MAMLSVDGVPIAEIDAGTAEFLKRLADKQVGALLAPIEAAVGEPRSRNIGELARSTLMRREYQQNCDVSLSLRFSERTERIERAS